VDPNVGHLLGLAPSAAAAAVLAENTGIGTDTLAKLTWSLDHGELPDWATAVGPSTLVIIDEAGMADHVRNQAGQDAPQPIWAPGGRQPDVGIIGEVAVWRAANGIDAKDRRPTGAGQLQTSSALWQHHLHRSLARCNGLDPHDVQERQAAGSSPDRRTQDRQRSPQPSPIRPTPPPGAGW
jgi:hypothetical protein